MPWTMPTSKLPITQYPPRLSLRDPSRNPSRNRSRNRSQQHKAVMDGRGAVEA
jgi:hypothetical protein